MLPVAEGSDYRRYSYSTLMLHLKYREQFQCLHNGLKNIYEP